MLLGSGSADGDRVPPVVVKAVADVVADANGSVAQVDDVVDMAVNQFDGDEVVALAGVVQDYPLGLQRLKLEINVGRRIGLKLRQADVGVLGFEIDRVMDALFFGAELGCYVGAVQLSGARQIDHVDAVEVKLLDLTHEIG